MQDLSAAVCEHTIQMCVCDTHRGAEERDSDVTWSLVFMKAQPQSVFAAIGWGLHTHRPKVDAKKCYKHSNKQKIAVEARVSADTDTTTHFSWVTSDD